MKFSKRFLKLIQRKILSSIHLFKKLSYLGEAQEDEIQKFIIELAGFKILKSKIKCEDFVMSIFESIVIGLLLTVLIGMFLIGKWVMVIMFNSRLINRKIEQHNLVDLELRFFRFLHFN